MAKKIYIPANIQREIDKACDVYRGFHWDKSASEVLLFEGVSQIPEVVTVLGDLTGVTYRTIKGKNGEPILYVHAFDEPLPVLACDTDRKQLFILGGRYTIENRGIVH